MSRARNIKPSFFLNDSLAECPPLARLLFAGLWTIADREGRLEDRPKKIKAEILPYDSCDCDDLLNQLVKRKFIQRYSVQGNSYIQVLNFTKHQNPHVKEAVSNIPAPDKHSTSPVQNVPLPDSPILIPPSPITGKPDDFVLPEWIPTDVWDAFMEVRKVKKAADTVRAKNSIVNELGRFAAKGHDPTAILQKSIRNSWKDVFEPKENDNGIRIQAKSKLELAAEGIARAAAKREQREQEPAG